MEEVTKWTKVKVGDTGNVFTGRTPSTKCPEYFGNEFLFITPGDMHQGKHVYTTERGLSTLGANLLRRIQLPPKSICVSCIGWQMGEAVMTSTISFTNQQINSIVPNDYVDANFLYYSFVPRKQELLSIASATGVRTPIMNKSDFCNLQVMLPPLSTQQKIASILSAYDDLIENNTKRIKILEEIAQTIYNEWFVKFRFPGHENVKMVDSELGMIPEGWEVKQLNQLVLFQSNGTNAGEHLRTRIYLPIDCIPRKSLSIREISSWKDAQSSLHLFDEGDILFGAMRPYFHKVVVAPFKGVTRKTCFVFKSISSEYHAFAALTLFRDETVSFANAHSKGATIPYAVWSQAMDGMPVIVPPTEQAKKFEQIVGPMLSRIGTMFFQSSNLRTTRDLLLPRLISGEIDVSELDIDVGGITA